MEDIATNCFIMHEIGRDVVIWYKGGTASRERELNKKLDGNMVFKH